MGIFSKLFKTGATVGATLAANKVVEKVQENNPDGVKDANNDGKVDYADYLIEAKKAAFEIYNEAAPAVKDAAQAKINELKTMYPDAADKIDDVLAQVKSNIK